MLIGVVIGNVDVLILSALALQFSKHTNGMQRARNRVQIAFKCSGALSKDAFDFSASH